jgi:DNA-directed RNA polymerase subunit RPC12/RpoP
MDEISPHRGEIICPYCGVAIWHSIDEVILINGYFVLQCANCKDEISIANYDAENIQESNCATPQTVLKIGTLITIVNKEHPWYKQIGLVRGVKHKHYRIEAFGKLIWMPADWVAIL